jgi:hypothetical protein
VLPARAVELYELALPAPLTEIRKSGDETFAVLGAEVFQLLPCAGRSGRLPRNDRQDRPARKGARRRLARRLRRHGG